MGYFNWLRVKSSNHLHTGLNLGYLKGTKFCLESKTSFIDISSIASFKPFFDCLVAGILHFFEHFRPRLGQNTPSWKIMFYYQTFFLFKYILY